MQIGTGPTSNVHTCLLHRKTQCPPHPSAPLPLTAHLRTLLIQSAGSEAKVVSLACVACEERHPSKFSSSIYICLIACVEMKVLRIAAEYLEEMAKWKTSHSLESLGHFSGCVKVFGRSPARLAFARPVALAAAELKM